MMLAIQALFKIVTLSWLGLRHLQGAVLKMGHAFVRAFIAQLSGPVASTLHARQQQP